MALLGSSWYFIPLWSKMRDAFPMRPYWLWTPWTNTVTCLWQLDWLWAHQLLWATVYPGERRIPSLGCLEWEQRLSYWASHVLPPHLFSRESLKCHVRDGERGGVDKVPSMLLLLVMMNMAERIKSKNRKQKYCSLFLCHMIFFYQVVISFKLKVGSYWRQKVDTRAQFKVLYKN